jgi:hypothetical protein
MHPYERWIARRYLATALKSKRRKGNRPNEYFHAWTTAHGRSLGVPALRYKYKSKSKSGPDDKSDEPETKLKFQAEWRRWRTVTIACARAPMPPISPLQERIDWLGKICGLTAPQQYVLGLLTRIACVQQVRNLVGAINREDYGSEQFDFGELPPVRGARVERRDLSENGVLTRFGFSLQKEILVSWRGGLTIGTGRHFRPTSHPPSGADLQCSPLARPIMSDEMNKNETPDRIPDKVLDAIHLREIYERLRTVLASADRKLSCVRQDIESLPAEAGSAHRVSRCPRPHRGATDSRRECPEGECGRI